MSNRDSIIDKIRKLRRMTEAAGASETEALMAAAQVAKLIAQYNVDESELRLKADALGLLDDFYSMPGRPSHFHTLVCKSICAFTHTKLRWKVVMEDTFGLGIEEPWTYVKFYGYPLDVEAAIALCSICQLAMISESENWEKRNPMEKAPKAKSRRKCDQLQQERDLAAWEAERKNRKDSFLFGLCERLSERIKNFAGQMSTGTGLIVLKGELVDKHYVEYLNSKGIFLRVSRARDITLNDAAYKAGRSHAENVDLGRNERLGASPQKGQAA